MERLDLQNLGITDNGLDALLKMKKLESVVLGWMAITDAGLKRLEGLNSLRMVRVLGCKVTSEGAETLRKRGVRVLLP